MSLRVEGSGSCWALYDGKTLLSITTHHDTALDQLDREIRRRKSVRRACLCCGEAFTSEGPHNRMCVRCRRAA